MQTDWQSQSHFRRPRSWKNLSVTVRLILITIAAFIGQIFLDKLRPGFSEHYFMLSLDGLKSGYLWQLITYLFLHGSLFHILANMLGLYFIGPTVEQSLGTKRFLILYFSSGIAGGLAQILVSGGAVLGASASVFAVILAFTTILPEMEITLLLFFIIPIRMRAKTLAYIAIGTTLFFIFVPMGDHIGHVAHLAGALTGYFYTRRLGYGRQLPWERFFARRKEQKMRQSQMSEHEFITEEIDPILDKIAQHGIHSLTRQERRILEQGRDKIERKTSVL